MIYEEILLYHYPDFVEEYEIKKSNNKLSIEHILTNDNRK